MVSGPFERRAPRSRKTFLYQPLRSTLIHSGIWLSALLVFRRNDFDGPRLLRRSASRNDSPLGHCERSEAISA
jgi:hypothetical protein